MTSNWQRTVRAVSRLSARRVDGSAPSSEPVESPDSPDAPAALDTGTSPTSLTSSEEAPTTTATTTTPAPAPDDVPTVAPAHSAIDEAPAPTDSFTLTVPASVAPFVAWAAPGHFYSPIPDLEEIERAAERIFAERTTFPGIDLREEEQLENFRELARLAREVPIPASPTAASRYGTDNLNYGIGDASMLQAMLRHLRPRRYLEVGSGWSTALALDTSEQFLEGSMSVTAIEPYPELLASCLREGDPVEIIAQQVQSVSLARFRELEANDVLFIDSSHVLKAASDVHFLFTSVLPLLAPGVYVHVHDMFWPFEYLPHWIRQGRAWNELYLVHTFLLFNDTFEIVLFNHYLAQCHRDVIASELPAMLENTGGALWIRRVR